MSIVASWHPCPVCDAELRSGAITCPNCRTDLRLFALPAEIGLDFYNEGLELARAGDHEGAEAKMHGAIAANPGFVDAYIVLGKLIAQRGSPKDLERALAYWQRARSAQPSEEQSRKLDHCVNTARAKLSDATYATESARRGKTAGLLAIGAIIAAACGVAGYMMRPVSHGTASAPIKADSQPSVGASKSTGEAPKDPVTAIREAIKRPDITVGRNGKTFVLHGAVQTDAEKRATLALAALAAGTQPGLVDGSDLRVAPKYSQISAARVEHMLHKFVNRVSTGRDPLRYARLSVTGGAAKTPLKVAGTVIDSRAAPEIVQLIKDVYPSANPVDVSGLKLRWIYRRPVRRWRRRADAGSGFGQENLTGLDVPKSSLKKPANVAQPGDRSRGKAPAKMYTVRPGDTIYGITHRYGLEASKWHELWNANRTTIHKPGSIPSGTILTLPAGWKEPESARNDIH